MPKQKYHHLADIFKSIFFNINVCLLIQIYFTFSIVSNCNQDSIGSGNG